MASRGRLELSGWKRAEGSARNEAASVSPWLHCPVWLKVTPSPSEDKSAELIWTRLQRALVASLLKSDVREMLLTVCVGERLSCPQNAQTEGTRG